MTVSLKKLDDLELTLLYSSLLKELKHRGIIRTNNVVGELGEYLAINFYNKTKGLPKLQAASNRDSKYRCSKYKRRSV